ncbi:protein NRDE2 homolog [Aspergillus udagawae]|nr:protein NRDE2 homolog [Aspergillus udagawae]
MDSSGSQEKKSIPRFASFKPPPAPLPQGDRPSDRRSHESVRRDEKSKHHSRHRSRRERSRSGERRKERKEHRPTRRDAEQRDVEPTRESVRAPKPVVREGEDGASDLYVIDRKGDKYNLIYGTLHRYNVPLYHRVGRGNVLGLPTSYRIDRDTAEGDALILKTGISRTDAKRIKSKSAFAGLAKQRTKLLRVRKDPLLDTAVEASKDFLPLDGSAKRRRKGTPEDIATEDERYAYRSIHGKAKPEDDIPSDLEAVSDTDSSDGGLRVDPDEEIKSRNAELLRDVERNPTDIEAWLRLIDHQELLLRGSERESRALTAAERKSLADIKLSLYEKALKKVGDSPFKDVLLLGLLEEGAKLWDTKKLSSQWQAVLKANSQFISLWIKYLDFRQTEFLDFTYERCFNTYLECLKLNRLGPGGPGKGHVQIYLFLRLTCFIREAGFTEHAAGLWQAILETVFFRPEDLSIGKDQETLSAFLDFWESEVSRIGEVGAKGWRSGENALMEPKAFAPQFKVELRSIFASWTVCERERISNAQLPARSLDETDEDDPYRIVIASDLREILPLVWDVDSTNVLIDGFMYYCQLPPLKSPENLESTSRWAGDNFLRNESMSNTEITTDGFLQNQTDGTEPSAVSPLSFPHTNFIQTTDTLFADQEAWFSSLRSWTKTAMDSRNNINPDWARRTLRLLIEANPRNDDLAEYALAVELACNSKEARKYAKSLLKKRSSNLRLYNSYALIEYRSGNHTAAEHAWATTLSMSKTFSDENRIDSVLLWQSWTWESLNARNIAQASHLLLSIPQNSVDLKAVPSDFTETMFSATSLLKAQNSLSEAQENALVTRKARIFVACTDCLALLAYLSQSFDMTKALEAYSHAMASLSTLPERFHSFRTFTTELLHQARARLIYYHVRTSSLYKPSQIRSLLTESISLFPHNTIFLSLFAWNESRFRIEERVREVVRDVTSETKQRTSHDRTTAQQIPITSHLFSVYTELVRPVYAGSTLHSVRAAFEKAIGDPAHLPHTGALTNGASSSTSTARSSLTLWKLYILFELSRHEINRAKEVFYRAIRACPWSKELVMLAFTHLRADVFRDRYKDSPKKGEGMGFDELRRVYNVLVEKELRIHVDIEDELDRLATRRLEGATMPLGPIQMPDDAESEDERMQL